MQQVEIRVKGQIDERWSEWLEGLEISHTATGETVLAGPILDQSALYGLISRLRDLGLALVSVNPAVADQRSALPPVSELDLEESAGPGSRLGRRQT